MPRSAGRPKASSLAAAGSAIVWPRAGPSPTKAAIRLRVSSICSSIAARSEAAEASKLEGCETALRHVQAYAVNAGDGPLMRACGAFSLQLSSAKGQRPEAVRAALEVCVNGVAKLVSLGPEHAARREEIAEGVRHAVGKATLQRAA
jgi:hypothetical protein